MPEDQGPLPPRHRPLDHPGPGLLRRAADAGAVHPDAAERLQVAGRLLDEWPAELADRVLHQGPGHLLEPGEFPAEALELHPDRCRGCRGRSAHLVAQRLRDRHRPGEGPAVDRRIVPAGQHDSAGGAGLPAVLLRQGGRALQHQARGDHHLHRHPERFRHLPARLGARHLPQGAAGGRRAGRRQPLADPVEGGLPDRPADPVGAADLLLHLDLERILHPAGDADRQCHPDRAGGAGVIAGRPADGCADHQRRRADQPDPRGDLLLHLPAHPDSRRHRRCHQIDPLAAIDSPLRHPSPAVDGCPDWRIDERDDTHEVQRRVLDDEGGIRRPASRPGLRGQRGRPDAQRAGPDQADRQPRRRAQPATATITFSPRHWTA